DKLMARNAGRRRAILPFTGNHIFTAVYKSVRIRFCQLPNVAKILVTGFSFRIELYEKGMVEVIQPLGVETIPANFFVLNDAWRIQVAFRNHKQWFADLLRICFHLLVDLLQEMDGAVIKNSMDSVQPEPVDVVMLKPMEGIFDKKIAYTVGIRPIKIDCHAPRCSVVVRKIRAEMSDVIPLGSQVVVHDIQNDGNAPVMACINQFF